MSREDLERDLQVLTELKARQKNFPLFYYEPSSEKVRPFHHSRKRIRILSGGNRSSKSHTGVAEAASYALGYRPWILRELGLPMPEKPWIRPTVLPDDAICFNGLGIRVPVPNEVFVVSGQSLKKGVGETLAPKFRKLLGPLITDEHMAHSGVPYDLVLKNGSRIVFGSAEQGPQSFESTNYTFTSIDEPIPRRVYLGISRGSVDQYAPIVMTFTPIGAWAGWMFKDLYAPAIAGGHPQIDIFNVSIFDNKFLSREAIEAFVNDPAISEQEKEARLYGRFMHLTDVVYSNFNQAVHVVPRFIPPRDWFHGMAVDPHSIKPWAIIYFAVAPNGDTYVYREWPEQDFTKLHRDPRSIQEYALLIRRMDGDRPIRARLMDPNYGPRKDVLRGHYVPSIVSDISQYDLHFYHQLNDDLGYGEGRVRALLNYDPNKPLDSLNRPRLYFTDECQNCIQSMTLYTSKPKLGGDGEIDDAKRIETYKDFADVIRYVAVSGITDSASADALRNLPGAEEFSASDVGCYGEAS